MEDFRNKDKYRVNAPERGALPVQREGSAADASGPFQRYRKLQPKQGVGRDAALALAYAHKGGLA